jgi:Putative Flp pilus-assembly TadE/G-like
MDRNTKRSEGGQALPVLLLLFTALLAAGAILFQVGRASSLSATAQTGADAAALAAAKNLRTQLVDMATRLGYSDLFLVNDLAVCAAARDYAARNESVVTSCEREGLEVQVSVVTEERLGEAAEPIEYDDFEGAERSRAELEASPLGLTGGLTGAIPGIGGGSGRIGDGAWRNFKEEFADGPLDIVALGRFLQNGGFQVGEHPAFGGVAPVHTDGSWHYRNGAIDVNFGAGQSASEMAAIDPLIPHLRSLGFGIIWRSEDHWDHLHVDLGGARPGLIGTDFAAGAWGPSVFEIKFVPVES